MAKRKVTVEHSDSFDDFADNGSLSGAVSTATGVVQPKPIDPTEGIVDGKQVLANLFGIRMEDVASLTKAKDEANIFAMASQAQEYAQKMKSEAEQKYKREWAGRSSRERTQEVVDKTWGKEPGTRIYRTALVKNPDVRGTPESIPLDIPAHSPEEARGRYTSVCGIISTDHFVKAVALEDIKARQARRADAYEESIAFSEDGGGENDAGEIVDDGKFMEN